jgi:NAD(P)-dependent dehydrogenase (short-subunit alcohol dehydrogenase family)
MSSVLVVTGGSRGIGAACARAGGRRGYKVCVNYNSSRDHAEAVVEEIRKAGGMAVAIGADVSTEDGARCLFGEAETAFGRMTALVNNAGTILPSGTILDVSAEALARLWRVNITSQFLCAREAVRRMSTAHGGRGGAIVNISSVHARTGAPGEFLAYAAGKGAIDTFTHGLAQEVVAQGIRVNAVRPGLIATDIHAIGGDKERAARLGPRLPMGRAGRPEEVAAAVMWLLSEEASYVTGALLDVGGGR